MKTGSIKRTVIKCPIVGAAGVGKTSIKHLLLNKELPEKRVSTGMLENPAVAVSKSRDISISMATMKEDGSWYVVHNDQDLINMIAEIIKAEAYDKKPHEKSEAINYARNEIPQDKSPATGSALESREVNSAESFESEVTEESQDDPIYDDCISAIMKAEGM